MGAFASNWRESKDFVGIVVNLLFVESVFSIIAVVIRQQLARIPAGITGLVICVLAPGCG